MPLTDKGFFWAEIACISPARFCLLRAAVLLHTFLDVQMSSTTLRNFAAHRVANLAAVISPYWRFRLWVRLTGDYPYETSQTISREWVTVHPHDLKLKLGTADWMERYAVNSGYFYQDEAIELLRYILRPGWTFVDVGANIGFMTAMAASLVGEVGSIVSIEPNPELGEILYQIKEKNKLENMSIFNVALAREEGQAILRLDMHHGSRSINQDATALGTKVDVRVADTLLERSNLKPNETLIKIDAEGAELLILSGMKNIISRVKPIFFIEIFDEQLARFNSKSEDIFRYLVSFGYSPCTVSLSPIRRKIKLGRIDRPLHKRSYDILFIPDKRAPTG